MESLLHACGAIHRKGTIKDKTTVGDTAPEARARQMSIETTAANGIFMDDPWIFLDCPGSIEFAQEAQSALMVADAAVVVVEPIADRALTLSPLLKFLDDHQIPHVLFINKMDTATERVRDVLAAFQSVSSRKLVLRHVPIRETAKDGSEIVTGYVDLVSERAYHYQPGKPSDLVPIPEMVAGRKSEARGVLLETLADYNDTLLEQLLEDSIPGIKDIYRDLARDMARDLIVPVVIGAAEKDAGVRRLLKLLRHEVPDHEATLERQGVDLSDAIGPVAEVFKTHHVAHSGKLSLARIWRGALKDGMTVTGRHGSERISGLFRMQGPHSAKLDHATAGDVVALGRMDSMQTGDVLWSEGGTPIALPWLEPLMPVYELAIEAESRSDEVKLMGAIGKLMEEDPSLVLEQHADTHQLVLRGQGEMHLLIALERLASKFNLKVRSAPVAVPYKETIRGRVTQHARYKRQTGGHGQFGDVTMEIASQPRGSGFSFVDKIVGGAIPRQFIPAVEAGVREYLPKGPLGFPVVDIAVTLIDGGYHTVDSSEMSFKQAARLAMADGMVQCDPVLLEPINQVRISVPNAFTSRVQRLISGRRGQILGFDAKPGWQGWDEVVCNMPAAETTDMIIELRSLTLGVGGFQQTFDHLQEVTGKQADRVVHDRQAASA
jgi:elongation factor G